MHVNLDNVMLVIGNVGLLAAVMWLAHRAWDWAERDDDE